MVPDGWIRAPLDKLVERVTKPVLVDPDGVYRQIGIRSHGKGLFDKEPVTGAELGNKRVSCFFRTTYGKYLLGLASPGGAGRNKTLGQTEFLKTIVTVPPIQEQKRIVQILKTWERANEILNRSIRNSEARQRGLIQKLLGGKAGRSAATGGWKVKPLKELASIYDGTHSTPDYQTDGVPFYSVEHVSNNDFSQTKFISRGVFERENKRVRLEKGDILMTRIGDIGTPRYIDWDVEASFYVSLALIKPDRSINGRFLSFYIQTREFQRELHKRSIHLAFPKKINLGEIGHCLVAFPPAAQQETIATHLILGERELATLKKELIYLEQEKRALIQELLAGKRRVKIDRSSMTRTG